MGLPAFRHFIEHELGKFPHLLLYALLEWTLIALLFIEGLVAFVAYEFAKIFDLRTPCSLCARIDHVLVHRNSDFYYNDAMCEDHKKDVSSLAYCHVHGKLSDIRSMCEGCLLSFNTGPKSSSDSTMTKSLECLFDDGLRARLKMPYYVRDDDSTQGDGEKAAGKRNGSGYVCSCCGEPMKVKSCYQKGSNLNNVNRVTQAPAPSPRAFAPWRNEESRNLESPHVKYTKLRLSDTSSPADDQDGENITLPGKDDPKSAAVPLLTESEEAIDEPYRSTPTYAKGGSNRFFGIPLTDSATASPRWSSRVPRKSLLDKTELAQDPVDACCTNDGDTDTILNRLKRQVRLDRKSLMALYMELDEERSASAIAANNAMAMITRLQAEKAAVQMEALQYQRMMEEQAEYDQEALQAMREMLDKRDVDIRELEAEVELYRERYGIIVRDVISDRGQDDGFEVKSCSVFSTERSERGSPRFSFLGTETDAENEHQERECLQPSHQKVDRLGSVSFDFERERSYLLGQLRMLESKMRHTSLTAADLSDRGTKIETKCQIQSPGDMGADDQPEPHTVAPTEAGVDNLANGTMGTETTTSELPQAEVPEVPPASSNSDAEITNSNLEEGHRATAADGSNYNVSISEEVSQLGQKLRALEEDGRFLKHAFLTLEKGGNEGSKLLGEIAFHLRKLRDTEKMQMISVL